MSAIDFSQLSQQERIELIGELWDSLGPADVPTTPSQATELQRRLSTLDEDIKTGRDAGDVLANLRC